MTTRLLVLVDESPASKRAVSYVARMVGRRRGFQLCLAHLLPPLPAGLMEFRGAENPDEEQRLDAALKASQRRWMVAAKEAAHSVFAGACAMLHAAGVPAKAVETRFFDPTNGASVAERIIHLARSRKCGTVVVGREAVSWFRELVRGDLAEELVRSGKGVTIWVVE
jgi:nucleotide-binding universal stress UspA family protein